MLNTELLDQALAWAEQEAAKPRLERKWVQSAWRSNSDTNGCGTAFCIAGYVAQVTGGQWCSNNPYDSGFDELVPEEGEPWDLERHDQKRVQPASRATRKLGLDWEEADYLYNGGNDIADIRRLVAEIKENHAEH